MVMQKHDCKVDYFRNKLRKARSEIERKKLDVSIQDIESRLENVGCIEVFRGVVSSHYYSIGTSGEEGLKFLGNFFGLERDRISTGGGGSFSRLREMVDDDGTIIYLVETRIYSVKVQGFSTPYVDKGTVCDLDAYELFTSFHDSNPNLKKRETEVKRRLCCILPSIDGLEFDLDKINEPVNVNPYLEVEFSCYEKPTEENIFDGAKRLGLDTSGFFDISARRLIQRVLHLESLAGRIDGES